MPGPQEKSAFVGLILWGLPAEFCSCKGLIFHRFLDLGHKGFLVLLVIHLLSLPKLQHILSSFSHVHLLWAVPSFDLSLSKSMNPGATTKCPSITTVPGKRKCTNTGVDSVFYSGLSLVFPQEWHGCFCVEGGKRCWRSAPLSHSTTIWGKSQCDLGRLVEVAGDWWGEEAEPEMHHRVLEMVTGFGSGKDAKEEEILWHPE